MVTPRRSTYLMFSRYLRLNKCILLYTWFVDQLAPQAWQRQPQGNRIQMMYTSGAWWTHYYSLPICMFTDPTNNMYLCISLYVLLIPTNKWNMMNYFLFSVNTIEHKWDVSPKIHTQTYPDAGSMWMVYMHTWTWMVKFHWSHDYWVVWVAALHSWDSLMKGIVT